MDIFEDLLQNTKGFSPDVMKDLRDNAETLQVMSGFAKFDLQQETQYVLDHLPELREQRAKQVDLEAAKEKNPQLRDQRKQEAARLHRAAEKLSAPNVDEQFKCRAALVELSIRFKARLREAAQVNPELDPVRLKKFRVALDAVAGSLPNDMGDKVEREQMARFQFIQELRDAGGNADLAVDNFYKAAFSDRERGHWNDIGAEVKPGEETFAESLDGGDMATLGDDNPVLHSLATQGPLGDWVDRQDKREHLEQVAANKVLQAMPKLAAEHLKPKQYAAYRVMIDNNHLIDWKITKDGKMRFKAKELDASSDSNTVGKILQREMDYQDIRGANDLIKTTIEKMNKLLHEHGGQEVAQTEQGRERLAKP
ncbi:hypothetical protein HF282_01090, partial [Acidithiobacillus ferrooxidans]|nr:hypothetical protein [Acidithiobacillus ferrooxidans]